ncbi:alpha-2-HS-glycoprotein 1 [Alosa sapidissima]|uniref:alpha-2-HS-glycoprotein 1 n=1 Tax=Alosa sapidissima TaxID=34773 RepID=UPI001C099A72|nr:alpha-2-HS-glycoprotein 1 [Alosa sapidissima]
MRGLLLLTLAIPAVLAASLPPTDKPFTCTEKDKEAAAKVAEHFINHHHHRGFKFRVDKITSAKAENKGTPHCQLLLELALGETKCHIIDPKPLEKCEIREFHDTQVKSTCSVTVKETDGKAIVEKYSCKTDAVPAEELNRQCPDCPSLIPLHDPQGLDSVRSAVKKFNEEKKQDKYFRLMEIGRMSTQWMFMGQSIFADFAIVETNCSADVKPEDQDDCLTLCDDEAHHGLCESTLLGNGEVDVQCTIFDIQNGTVFHHHPPPTAANCTKLPVPHMDPASHPPFGRPPHGPHGDAGPPGPPGPPGPLGRPGHHKRPGGFGPMELPTGPSPPVHFFPQCPGVVKIPPTIHPICPFPPPPPPKPRHEHDHHGSHKSPVFHLSIQ